MSLPDPSRTQQTLELIANVLGCSTSAFFDKPEPFRSQADLTELLQLWNSITNDENRQKVLAYARWIVEEQSVSQ